MRSIPEFCRSSLEERAVALEITRCPENPIVWPHTCDWRRSTVYHPAALYEDGQLHLQDLGTCPNRAYTEAQVCKRDDQRFRGLLVSLAGFTLLLASEGQLERPVERYPWQHAIPL